MNVLLIIMDSVRAHNTGLHGYRRDTTPFLDSFAEDCIHFSEARAPASWSLPSHTSMFTGLNSYAHGHHSRSQTLDSTQTVWHKLENSGRITGAFSSNAFLTELDVGLKDPFSHVMGPPEVPLGGEVDPRFYKDETVDFLKESLSSGSPVRSLAGGVVSKIGWDLPQLLPESYRYRTTAGPVRDEAYVSGFLDWMDGQDEWAAVLNLMDAHSPYLPKPEYDKWATKKDWDVQESMSETSTAIDFYNGEINHDNLDSVMNLYDGTIRQTDANLQRLIENIPDDTVVVITADHSESFGESSESRPIDFVAHNTGLNEEGLHVPLLVYHPELDGQTVEKLASPIGFPEFVDRFSPESFVRDELLIFDGDHMTSYEQIEDPEIRAEVEKHSYALYQQKDEYLTKESMCTGETNEAIESRIGSTDTANILCDSTNNTLSQSTEDHLEDLGYL